MFKKLFKKKSEGIVSTKVVSQDSAGGLPVPAADDVLKKSADQKLPVEPGTSKKKPPATSSSRISSSAPEFIRDELRTVQEFVGGAKFLVRFTVFILFLVGLTYGGLWWYADFSEEVASQGDVRLISARQRIAVLKKETNKFKKLESRVEAVYNLLDQHVSWVNFLDTLAKYTMPEIFYNSLDVDLSGDIRLTGRAKTVSDLNWQYLVLAEASDLVSEIELSGYQIIDEINLESVSESGEQIAHRKQYVEFSFDLNVNPEIFYR